jgi:hypothetical protein
MIFAFSLSKRNWSFRVSMAASLDQPRQDIFFFSHLSTLLLGSTHPPIQWGSGGGDEGEGVSYAGGKAAKACS